MFGAPPSFPTATTSAPPPGPTPAPTAEPPRRGGWNPHSAYTPTVVPSSPPAAGPALPFGSVRDYGALPGAAPPFAAPPPPFASSPPFAAPPPPGAYAHGGPHAPHVFVPKAASFPWWIGVVIGVVVLGTMVPYVVTMIATRRATSPDAIATNVEREVLKQPRPPCPFPEQCSVTREEHGLVYPLCTKKSAKNAPYKPGEMVLAGADNRIALVNSGGSDGRYALRFLTGQTEVTLGDDEIAGRLCRAAPTSGGAQVAP
jgi:hypothetical protein